VDPRAIVRPEGLGKLEKIHLIGKRSRYLPFCSIVPYRVPPCCTYQYKKKTPYQHVSGNIILTVLVIRILCRHQQQFSINVLAWIVGDILSGPHVLPRRLTGNHYRDFLLHDLPKLPEDVSLAVRARMWYMHDGAPAHFSRAVRDLLSNTYHDRWTGKGGPTAWLPRPPELNPLDSYLWGHIEALVHAAPVVNDEALHHCMWMPVRLSATTPASLNGRGCPW
jgi:hypothetical protein